MIDKIKVNNITKVFDSVIALNNVNIQFEKGKVYALLGHNGAGKTTLIQNILGIQKLKKTIDSGEIIYLSNEIKIRGNEYKESDFCFLDEPFSGLDPVSIFKLKSFLCDDIEKNRTYIISTHQLAILESIVIPDELMVILLMKDGKLIHKGTKKNLLESTGEESIEKAYIKLS